MHKQYIIKQHQPNAYFLSVADICHLTLLCAILSRCHVEPHYIYIYIYIYILKGEKYMPKTMYICIYQMYFSVNMQHSNIDINKYILISGSAEQC